MDESRSGTAGLARTTTPSFIADLCEAVRSCDGGDTQSRHLIGRAIVDTLGVAAAGFVEPVTGAVLAEYAHGSGVAAWSGELCETTEAAVFVNAVASHALDFDDVYLASTIHPSTVILPAILQAGRERDPDEFVAAFGAGLIAARAVAARVGQGHYHKGWHGTGTIGAFASAAAIGRLWRLDEDTLRSAFALAASQSGGLKRSFGTAAKPCHAGFAAVAGFRAVRLARAGVDGSPDIFGPGGYADLYGGADGLEAPNRDAFDLRVDELALKLYPCCYAGHRLIGLALEARDRLGAIFDDPGVSIALSVPAGSLDVLKYHRPTTSAQAKFSGPYMVASALREGMPNLAHFDDAAVRDQATRALMERIRIVEDGSQVSGGDIQFGQVTLNVNQAGREYAFTRSSIPGGPDSPPTVDEVRSKFEACVSLFEAGRGHAYPALSEIAQVPETKAWLGKNVT